MHPVAPPNGDRRLGQPTRRLSPPRAIASHACVPGARLLPASGRRSTLSKSSLSGRSVAPVIRPTATNLVTKRCNPCTWHNVRNRCVKATEGSESILESRARLVAMQIAGFSPGSMPSPAQSFLPVPATSPGYPLCSGFLVRFLPPAMVLLAVRFAPAHRPCRPNRTTERGRHPSTAQGHRGPGTLPPDARPAVVGKSPPPGMPGMTQCKCG